MSEQCCVIGCPNGTVETTNKFYRFPKDKNLLEEWKTVLKIKRPLSHYRVCGLHFTEGDFKLTNLGKEKRALFCYELISRLCHDLSFIPMFLHM